MDERAVATVVGALACLHLLGQGVQVDSLQQVYGLPCLKQRRVNGLKVLQHDRAASVRIATQVVLAVERMREPIAFFERSR